MKGLISDAHRVPPRFEDRSPRRVWVGEVLRFKLGFHDHRLAWFEPHASIVEQTLHRAGDASNLIAEEPKDGMARRHSSGILESHYESVANFLDVAIDHRTVIETVTEGKEGGVALVGLVIVGNVVSRRRWVVETEDVRLGRLRRSKSPDSGSAPSKPGSPAQTIAPKDFAQAVIRRGRPSTNTSTSGFLN